MSASPSWDPDQYRRFAAERAQPFRDLLAKFQPSHVEKLVDLGCGPGEMTTLAASHTGAAHAFGIDNSASMLLAAARYANEHVHFVEGDISTWSSNGDIDLLISSASLHWIPDHLDVLHRWSSSLTSGGQLLVQIPANADRVAQSVASEVASRHRYLSAFGIDGPPPDPVALNVLSPVEYAEALFDLGFEEQSVQLRIYPHVLASTSDVVEWVKGTTLRRFAEVMGPELYGSYVEDYSRELIAAMGEREPCFFPFPRILIWARQA